ncbi:MAG: twin-arginine translocase subunit TatB [Pseudomonadota bacterium]|nr:MAG: twin-arginine translocase subunit TatB [Pseudomonadota bacterium]
MFDIGFWEILVIGVIALLVIGPDRLPGVARTVGTWVGRTRRFVGQVKNDIDKEIRAEELKKALQNNASLHEIQEIVKDARQGLQQDIAPDYLVKAQDDSAGSSTAQDTPRVTSPTADAETDQPNDGPK